MIKGGPGCGKSSFMKMLGSAAEKAGLSVEYAVCSGDPGSLDGIYIPELKTAYTDGTAPHIADTCMAGVDSAYLDMGVFYDYDTIAEYKPELRTLYRECADSYKKAYALIAAAGQLQSGWNTGFVAEAERQAALKRTGSIALREFGKHTKEKGKATYRFLSAHTCRGLSALTDTAETLCGRFYIFENRLKLGSSVLAYLKRAALDCGFDATVCLDPLNPSVPEALLVPSLSLGFVCSDSALADIPEARHIRLDALADSEHLKKRKPELRRCEKMQAQLLEEAYKALADSKRYHDSIEGIYNPNVDFDGIGELVRKHTHMLGLS